MAIQFPPTVNDLRNRFSAFADYDDDLVEDILEEAIETVSAGDWIERDRVPAVLNLAAHNLTLTGTGISGGSGATPAGAVLKAREVGDTRSEFEYSGGSPASGSTPLAGYYATDYGRKFLELARRSFPPVMVV
jgi:hypothetical protein